MEVNGEIFQTVWQIVETKNIIKNQRVAAIWFDII